MKRYFLVSPIVAKATLAIGEPPDEAKQEISLAWHPGQVGVCLMFDTREAAEECASHFPGADIVPFDRVEPVGG